MKIHLTAAAAFVASLSAAAPGAHVQTGVTVHCSVLADWCELIAVEFEEQSGIRVNVAQQGSGETLAPIRATVPAPAPNLSEMKLIDCDVARYGSSGERKRQIEKWEKDVGSQPS